MFIQRNLDRCWLEASQFFSVLLLTGARQVGKTAMPIGTGALVSLYPQVEHVQKNILAIPAAML